MARVSLIGWLLLSPAGRVGRVGFVVGLCLIVAATAASLAAINLSASVPRLLLFGLTILLLSAVTSISIKRLHDLGVTGIVFALGFPALLWLGSSIATSGALPKGAMSGRGVFETRPYMNPVALAMILAPLGLGAIILAIVPGRRAVNGYGLAPLGAFEMPTSTGACQLCGRYTNVEQVAFYENVGMIIARTTRKVTGRLCFACANRTFWEFTSVTALAGWWAPQSFFITPFKLLANLYYYALILPLAWRKEPRA